MRKRPTRPVCPSLCDRLPTECLSDAAHAHHGTRRGGELPRSVRSWISTSSWPKNPSRPITYLRQDLAKGQRQLRRVLGRLPSQRFDDVPELVGGQRDRLQLTSAVPRLPRALSRRPLFKFAPAHRGHLVALLPAQFRGFLSEAQKRTQWKIRRLQIQTRNRDQPAKVREMMNPQAFLMAVTVVSVTHLHHHVKIGSSRRRTIPTGIAPK